MKPLNSIYISLEVFLVPITDVLADISRRLLTKRSGFYSALHIRFILGAPYRVDNVSSKYFYIYFFISHGLAFFVVSRESPRNINFLKFFRGRWCYFCFILSALVLKIRFSAHRSSFAVAYCADEIIKFVEYFFNVRNFAQRCLDLCRCDRALGGPESYPGSANQAGGCENAQDNYFRPTLRGKGAAKSHDTGAKQGAKKRGRNNGCPIYPRLHPSTPRTSITGCEAMA